ncbi:DNA-(apurinic or apyrimidinic site) endonuclease 2-like isoform X2 [Cloeon dipterum]|uniref:DNA-(apurinic or apyrimidinic site) endonuclease 2-like isoform X2 n=1 Tax=Cloeon dipterum TaxID=197152 RepID=UPI00321F93D6
MLRIATWNINGLRSFTQSQLKEALDQIDADIICLQETKLTGDVIDEQIVTFDGYNSFFSFSRVRSGYSGVATLCRSNLVPVKAEEGLSEVLAPEKGQDLVGCYGSTKLSPDRLKQLDSEGRAVLTQFVLSDGKPLTVINVYCPRADPDRYEERLAFKLDFYHLLEARAHALVGAGGHVVVLGDLNTSHKPIDHCDPGDLEEFQNNLGRLWMDRVVTSCAAYEGRLQLVDAFRQVHPDMREAFTCWNTQKRARATNYGTRIDYILLSAALSYSLVATDIMAHVLGSDHCPVRAQLEVQLASDPVPLPSLCSRFLVVGKQQKLSAFFAPQTKLSSEELKKPCAQAKNVAPKQMSLTAFIQKRPRLQTESAAPELVAAPRNAGVADAWRAMLSGPRPPPLCSGHKEPSVQRTVKKPGPNFNRLFYACARGEGHKDNPESRCNFFQWAPKK